MQAAVSRKRHRIVNILLIAASVIGIAAIGDAVRNAVIENDYRTEWRNRTTPISPKETDEFMWRDDLLAVDASVVAVCSLFVSITLITLHKSPRLYK